MSVVAKVAREITSCFFSTLYIRYDQYKSNCAKWT